MRKSRWTWLSIRPGMRYWPRGFDDPGAMGVSGTRPAAPAQSKSDYVQITVMASLTGALPVPSHNVAPTMAIEGLTRGGGTSLAGGGPQAAATRPTSTGSAGKGEDASLGSLLQLASSKRAPTGAPRTAR